MTTNYPGEGLVAQALQQVSWLILIEVVLIFALPADQAVRQVHHFSSLQYRLLLFGLTLPVLATWLAAFFGYAKLRLYVESVRETPEGPHFAKLAQGCGWLAWSLPVSTIMILLLSAAANQWPAFYPAAVIIRNYVNLGFSLIAFSLVGNASRALVNQAKLKFSLASIRAIIVLFLVAGVLYCYLTFKHFNLTSLGTAHNSYYLPIWLMVATVMIPYLYAWFSGLLAAYEIDLLSKQTHGILYRQALRLLVTGLLTIIFSFVALQYISSLHPNLHLLSLDYLGLLNLLFRLTSGAGFLLLAIGAARLKKIEEV